MEYSNMEYCSSDSFSTDKYIGKLHAILSNSMKLCHNISESFQIPLSDGMSKIIIFCESLNEFPKVKILSQETLPFIIHAIKLLFSSDKAIENTYLKNKKICILNYTKYLLLFVLLVNLLDLDDKCIHYHD